VEVRLGRESEDESWKVMVAVFRGSLMEARERKVGEDDG